MNNLRPQQFDFSKAPVTSAPGLANWYALYTRSRFEKKIHADLLKWKLEAFLPLVKEQHLWSDRLKTIQVPLLPSYVFVKGSAAEVRRVTWLDGVVRLVSFEGKPCVIREAEISLLNDIVLHGFKAQCSDAQDCKVGDLVRIVRGPMKGWEGRVQLRCGQARVVFQIESIRQVISVEVGVGDVERV